MEVLLLGMPGAGKGIQVQFITAVFGIPRISTGNMLHAMIGVGTPLGLEAKKTIDKDGLICGDTIIGMVKERIVQGDCENGLLFDGFSHTLAQVEAMAEAGVDLDTVVEVDVSSSMIVGRMSGRRVYLAPGRIYHVTYSPPKVEGKDDTIGEDLIQYDDSREETVKKHLAVYYEQAEVLADFYSRLKGEHALKHIKIDGTQPIEVMKAEVSGALGK